MTHNYTVKGLKVEENEIKIIKDAKWNLIDRLNFSGTYYSSIRMLSSMFNQLIFLFNTDDEATFDISEYEVGFHDFKRFEEYLKIFYQELKDKNLSQEMFNEIEKFLTSYIKELEITTKKIQEKRQENQQHS